MKKSITILVTGVGGGSVGSQIIKALRNSRYNYRIIGTDITKNSFGLSECDQSYIVPQFTKKNYIKKILEICNKHKVDCTAPGTDGELLKFSQNEYFFKKKNIHVLSNSHNVLKLCFNKADLFQYLKMKKISIPKFYIVKDFKGLKKMTYPVVIKPVEGGGSRSVFLAESFEETKFFVNYLIERKIKVIIQEYLPSLDEFTVGVIRLQNGKIKRSIAMKRDLEKSLSQREVFFSKKSRKKLVISSGISQGTFDDFKDIRKYCEKISDIVGAQGPLNIQCRKTSEGIIPFEINPRFSGTTSLRSLVGFNELDMIIRYKMFNEIPPIIRSVKNYVARDLVEKVIK